MMAGTVALAAGFGSSDRLAGAYGTAVSTTMLLTTALLYNAMRGVWRWPAAVAVPICAVFLAIDLVFFAANALKIGSRAAGCRCCSAPSSSPSMLTWRAGMDAMRARQTETEKDPQAFLAALRSGEIPRVPGTAVFLSRGGQAIPAMMVRHVAQLKVLPATAVSLAVRFEEVPRVPDEERAEVEQMTDGLWRVKARFGFMDVPGPGPSALAHARDKGCPLDLADAVYFATRDDVARSENHPRLMGLAAGPVRLPVPQRRARRRPVRPAG